MKLDKFPVITLFIQSMFRSKNNVKFNTNLSKLFKAFGFMLMLCSWDVQKEYTSQDEESFLCLELNAF